MFGMLKIQISHFSLWPGNANREQSKRNKEQVTGRTGRRRFKCVCSPVSARVTVFTRQVNIGCVCMQIPVWKIKLQLLIEALVLPSILAECWENNREWEFIMHRNKISSPEVLWLYLEMCSLEQHDKVEFEITSVIVLINRTRWLCIEKVSASFDLYSINTQYR